MVTEDRTSKPAWGEAKDEVEAELASVSIPTVEQVPKIPECHYNNPHMIMKQLIGAHKGCGESPSHTNASWETVYHIVSKHCKIINSCKELATKEGEAHTIFSWPYLEELEMELPPEEQRHLNVRNNNSAERFTELEGVYKDLKETSLFWMI